MSMIINAYLCCCGRIFPILGGCPKFKSSGTAVLTPPPSQAAVAQTDRRHRSRTEMAQKWGEWQKMNGSFDLFSFAESTLSIITLNQFPTFQFCFLPFLCLNHARYNSGKE